MAEKPIDLGLTALDELFMTDAQRQEIKLPRIRDIPLDQIDDMPNHPYKVRMDEDMEALTESVRTYGIITPVILRKKEDGRFECAAGHRRRKAAELAGHTTIRAEVREMTRDEAIILMVDSNLQRTAILPSEKAFSYKMRLEAMKRQAGRPPKNYSPVGNNFAGATSSELMAEETGESKNQIFRYIRLTNLVPALLDMVDEGRIAFRPAVELSYLTEQEQQDLLETISYEDATPSLAQAIKMKEFSKAGKRALYNLKEKLDDEIFREWCDTLIACQDDRTLKDTLLPVVSKLTDVRIVNNELKGMLAAARNEYWVMVALVVGNIPLLYVLNKEWFHTLIYETSGKVVLGICGVVILVTALFMLNFTKPIEYKR